ncbi:hypothetical protein AcV5_004912 [Taiwanofungus camphoratus]|nr:hypothetical protein AcV5_004912 [Antrodia cinnamomea]
MATFPPPIGGASLLLSFRGKQTVLIVGSNSLAASRAFSALEADSTVIVIANGGQKAACDEIRWRADQGQLNLLDLDSLPSPATGDKDASALSGFLSAVKGIRLVCVTDTVIGTDPTLRRGRRSAEEIAKVCRNCSIPVNVTDMPDLCDFSFMSTHRFHDSDTGLSTPLQFGVTTNGQGCRLAGRLRRDIVARLPKEVGGAVARVGRLRNMAKPSSEAADEEVYKELYDEGGPPTPNQPVPPRCLNETVLDATRRRMKWVAQVSEYWPIEKLARMSDEEMMRVLDGNGGFSTVSGSRLENARGSNGANSLHGLSLSLSPCGRIFLVGSGPGHPSLLTVATHAALTKYANLVLSDKLVPAAVLALIPPDVEVRIARKFPGNADGAQAELMEAAVDAASRGLTVVRLKQGDPTVYGRAGEEVLYFRAHGFEPVVVPGVSSVLAGPTLAGIPVTQRGAAESFIVCTGVGRQGKEVQLPGYERSRTLIILMGVARLSQVLETLLANSPVSDTGSPTRRHGTAYPSITPIAIIERASMPDQRVIFSTLQDVAAALESAGDQRPPGMIVIGWSVLSLWGKGDVTVLDDGAVEQDQKRLKVWLGDRLWRIVDGLDVNWENW